jgi:hypothetical protein
VNADLELVAGKTVAMAVELLRPMEVVPSTTVVLVDVEVAPMTAVVMAVPKADSFHRECSESGFEKLLSCYFKD